jgi:hypothetical protein
LVTFCLFIYSFCTGVLPAGSGTSCRERGKAGKAELVPLVAGVGAAFFLLPGAAPFFFISRACVNPSFLSFSACFALSLFSEMDLGFARASSVEARRKGLCIDLCKER